MRRTGFGGARPAQGSSLTARSGSGSPETPHSNHKLTEPRPEKRTPRRCPRTRSPRRPSARRR
ncbi:hypothetical protein FF096_20555 [Micromonospora sp. CP22]|nr:hypothetical protein [Micromonospora sp. CP22]